MSLPVLAVDGSLSFLTDVDVDFGDDPLVGAATYTVNNGAVWDTSLWDQSSWAAGLQITKEWQSPAEWQGVWISGKLKIATNSLQVQWISSDYIYQQTDNPMG